MCQWPVRCARALSASLSESLLPFAFCSLSSLLPRAPLAAPALRSPQMSGPARPQGARDARKTKREARAPHDRLRYRYATASRGAHLYFYVSYDSEPVHPGPHPSRKDGLLAQDPKGGDGDRELLRFSKRRCEIEPGARDAPTSAREGASPGVQG